MASSEPLFTSPPVVQHAGPDGFTVSIEVGRLCTGQVEWGLSEDDLPNCALAAPYGLIDADEQCLMIPVRFPAPLDAGQSVFYRVLGQAIDYASAYEISRGDRVGTAVRRLKLPHAAQDRVRLAVVNDTHERDDIVAALAQRVEVLDPDLVVWNGDACRSYDTPSEPAELLLRPGAPRGWASTRPLLFNCGNHDIRGRTARQLPSVLAPGPEPQLPWNVARRLGSLALLTLDAGEDKPDHHPAFAGTAAYEPYRERQAAWLKQQLARPEIAEAPFKLAFCHIPLRGLPGENDGSTLIDHARYSGHGARLWLPALTAAGVHAVVSGHTHSWRIDEPTLEQPIAQLVGGGPSPESATLIAIDVSDSVMTIRIEGLGAEVLATHRWDNRERQP